MYHVCMSIHPEGVQKVLNFSCREKQRDHSNLKKYDLKAETLATHRITHPFIKRFQSSDHVIATLHSVCTPI